MKENMVHVKKASFFIVFSLFDRSLADESESEDSDECSRPNNETLRNNDCHVQ